MEDPDLKELSKIPGLDGNRENVRDVDKSVADAQERVEEATALLALARGLRDEGDEKEVKLVEALKNANLAKHAAKLVKDNADNKLTLVDVGFVDAGEVRRFEDQQRAKKAADETLEKASELVTQAEEAVRENPAAAAAAAAGDLAAGDPAAGDPAAAAAAGDPQAAPPPLR